MLGATGSTGLSLAAAHAAEAGGAADAVIIDTEGTDWSGVLLEDQWTEIRGSLGGMKTAAISFGAATRRGSMTDNSEARAVAFDFIRVVGNTNSTGLDQRASWPLASGGRRWLELQMVSADYLQRYGS